MKQRTAGSQGFRSAMRTVWSAAVLALLSQGAIAQTLDSQYEFYLVGTPSFSGPLCANLGVVRDSNQQVVPGQFGPNLTAFCNYATFTGVGVGFPAGNGTGGSSGNLPGASSSASSTSAGGGAGSSASRGHEESLQRRREESRGDTPAPGDDVELLRAGNFSVFASIAYLRQRQKPTPFEGGRHARSLDGMLGADYRIGSRSLLGAAIAYGDQGGDIDSGGKIDGTTLGLWVYATHQSENGFFIDGAAGFDRQSTDTTRNVSLAFSRATVQNGGFNVLYEDVYVPEAIVTNAVDSDHLALELRSGYDFHAGALTIGPRIAATYRHTQIGAYTERGNSLMTLSVDSQTANSLQTLAGLQTSMAFSLGGGVIVPQINADWVHEHRDNQRTISARFVEDLRSDPTVLRFFNQAPDRDWMVARLNVVAVFPHGVSAFAAWERSLAHSFLRNSKASVGVRVEL